VCAVCPTVVCYFFSVIVLYSDADKSLFLAFGGQEKSPSVVRIVFTDDSVELLFSCYAVYRPHACSGCVCHKNPDSNQQSYLRESRQCGVSRTLTSVFGMKILARCKRGLI
jgi:hypothetical protein